MIETKTWTEVTITGTRQDLEIVSAMLYECGSCGSEEGDGWVKVLFPTTESSDLRQCIEDIMDVLDQQGLRTSNPVYRIVKQEDWGSAWREHFQPVQITPRILVIPAWMDDPRSGHSIVLKIMPRMAFGTGTHETTQLMITSLEAVLRPGWSVLDAGTGSGILAIAAARLGAGEVTAFDIDPMAVLNAVENFQLNGVEDRVRLWCGPMETSRTTRYDMIMANIEHTALVQLLPEFQNRIKKEGRIILSGILAAGRPDFDSALSTFGFRTKAIHQLGEWVAYVLIRSYP